MNRYEPLGGGQTKKATWPLCELRVSYKCQLCESEHQAIARSRGIMMDAELSKRFMNGVKVDLVNKFFQEHPKAKLEDFEIDRISAEELITHEEGEEPEKDNIGVPWTTSDIGSLIGVKAITGEEKLESKDQKKKEKAKLSVDSVGINQINKDSSLSDLENMSFADLSAGDMEKIFRQKLKEVKEREEQLKIQIMLLAHERVKYETMITAIDAVEKQKKEDAKTES